MAGPGPPEKVSATHLLFAQSTEPSGRYTGLATALGTEVGLGGGGPAGAAAWGDGAPACAVGAGAGATGAAGPVGAGGGTTTVMVRGAGDDVAGALG
ncbi:hypothetical protein TTY48_29410 [Tsukamurella sp. TY48]|nr:hypothetical protein TTY48_29410 [Tsukamurella sp. TY48]